MSLYSCFKEDANQDKVIENSSFVIIEDEEAIIQQLGTTLRRSKNDWFLNLDEGLNWSGDDESIMGSLALSLENEANITLAALGSPGITSVLSLTTEFKTATGIEINIVFRTQFSTNPVNLNIVI